MKHQVNLLVPIFLSKEQIKELRWASLQKKHAREGLDKAEQVEVAVLTKTLEADDYARALVEKTLFLQET